MISIDWVRWTCSFIMCSSHHMMSACQRCVIELQSLYNVFCFISFLFSPSYLSLCVNVCVCVCLCVCRYWSCQLNSWYRVIHMDILHHTHTQLHLHKPNGETNDERASLRLLSIIHSLFMYGCICPQNAHNYVMKNVGNAWDIDIHRVVNHSMLLVNFSLLAYLFFFFSNFLTLYVCVCVCAYPFIVHTNVVVYSR